MIDYIEYLWHYGYMSEQDAQDINKMMSSEPEVVIAAPKKSKFIWIVLGCVIVGVGLGVVVYQQSIKAPTTSVKTTPKPTSAVITPVPTSTVMPITTPTSTESATIPKVEFVTAAANTMTFPKSGKLRVFTNINNILLVIKITTGGSTKTLTIPNKAIDATTLLTYVDSTFDVVAGSTATIVSTLNAGGPQNMGWILPTAANLCGANQGTKLDVTAQIAWAESHLAAGQTIFAKQCWADPGSKTVIQDNDFNDFVLFWSYASATSASTSPAASPSLSPSPSPSRAASPSPSPSVRASVAASVVATPTPTPVASPRVSMPDTTDGTPVTGIFEITVGTISVGIVFLILGLFGLLVL